MENNCDFQIKQNGIKYIINLSKENNVIIVNCYECQQENTNEFYAHFYHEQLKNYSPMFQSTNSIDEDFIIFKNAIDAKKVRINKSPNNEINLTFILDKDEQISQNIELPLEVNGEFNNTEIEYLPPRILPTISVKANTIKPRRPTIYIDADNNEISKNQFYNNNDIIINQNISPISSPKKNVIVKKITSNDDLNNPINHQYSQTISKTNNVYSPQKEFINPPITNQIIHKTTFIPSNLRNQFSSPPKIIKEKNYYNISGMSPPREKIIYTNNGSPSKNQMDYSSYTRNKKNKIKVNNIYDSPVISPNLSTNQRSDYDEKINQLSSQINNIQNEFQKQKSKLDEIPKNNNNQNIIKEYARQIDSLKKQLYDENKRNKELIVENKKLKEIINKLNNEINKSKTLQEQIKILENNLAQKNIEIQNILSQNNKKPYEITYVKPGEKVMSVNFVSMGNQDIGHFSLVCKNVDLFVKLEERLYEKYPEFKKCDTYFLVDTKRIKRFLTLEQNGIQDNSIINLYPIDE